MSELIVKNPSFHVPAIVSEDGNRARMRYVEFFVATIRNEHTRRAYKRQVDAFIDWCARYGVPAISAVTPIHVGTYVESLGRDVAKPSVKQGLAAVRKFFDFLVTGHIIEHNPASSVKGPAHSVKRGKTPILDPAEARIILDSIDVSTPIGLRDRALIALMVYSFARIGAAVKMRVEDVFVANRRLSIRLHEKGGKEHEMPCHHNLETYLHAYIDGTGIGDDPKGPLFRTIGKGTGQLTRTALAQSNAHAMVRRRAEDAEIKTKIGNHTFRGTGITAYLKNGGALEMAKAMANHSSTRTTQLYDRRPDDVTLDEVERIRI